MFEPDEIAAARELVSEHLQRQTAEGVVHHGADRALHGDFSALSGLCRFILDERVLRFAREVLGATPTYFRDGSMHIGRGIVGWHKDNRQEDRTKQDGPDWQGRYPLIRIGIYLQDHTEHSGGLSVRVGSHLPVTDEEAYRVGRMVHVDSGVGDIVAWNLRTTHSGNSVRVRGMKKRKLSPKIERMLPDFVKVDAGAERMAMFFTYGAESDHLDRYIAYLGDRGHFGGLKDTPPCPEFLSALPESDVRFVDPVAAV